MRNILVLTCVLTATCVESKASEAVIMIHLIRMTLIPFNRAKKLFKPPCQIARQTPSARS